MENKLEINKNQIENALEIIISGRIDARWSEYLNSFLDAEIRAGNHNLVFKLDEVTFISSIGIRLFIKYSKELYKINGILSIVSASADVKKVFELAGLGEMFHAKTISAEEQKPIEQTYHDRKNAGYSVTSLGKQKNISLRLIGHPEKLKTTDFSPDDFTKVEFRPDLRGIGLGALGGDYSDFSLRTGEFIGMGNVAAYLPSDGSSKPDYIVKTANLLPAINVLYGLTMEGKYSLEIRFELKPEVYLSLSQLIEDLIDLSGFDNVALCLLTETSGLVGASLNQSPYAGIQGSSPFTFPEIRQTINFTTEPVYKGSLSVICGIADKSPKGRITEFLRPIRAGSQVHGHFHAAVFPYVPLKKKDIQLEETLTDLFENSHIQNILHLINDEREYSGIGESEFKQGICWVENFELKQQEVEI
ncbi:MAG: STAS domain-containing protein [Bacteroidales bacterium]